MSLFKTRTFWHTNCDAEEFFDQNSLIVTKLNSDSDYIVTGSHSGLLRIFKPSSELTDNNNLTEYKATDLIIEKIFDHPILQVGSGKFVSGSPKFQLAVLQPQLLSVYSLITKDGATDHGVQNILQLLYEHKLRRSSANFTIGPFGGTQNRDFICVQSLDGLLTFFEQESFTCCCFLPHFLLPAPMAFAKKSDSFITCSSNWNITSFKYKLLSEAGQNSAQNALGKIDWSFDLGEAIIDLQVIDDPNSKENHVLVLGERNLFCISDTGKLKFMKKLDFSPICFTNYILNDRILSLVVSETSTLLIYQNTSLKWSANLSILPIAIKRAFLHGINGALVLLSEMGELECCYLGTEPSLFVAPPLATQDLDFEQAGLELATLHKIIKNSYANDIKHTNASAERELVVNVSISPHLEPCNFPDVPINQQMCLITVEIVPQALFEEVQIAIVVQRPLKVEPQVEFFNNLSNSTSMQCYAFMAEVGQIPSLNVEVVATFISNLGVPRSITKCSMLPLNLVVETCPPLKEGEHKVTLNINQSPVGLAALFPEFAGQNSLTTSSNCIGFRNCTEAGKVVTILLAKSSERYRLQSDSLASLNLLIEQIIHRLSRHFANKTDFSIGYSAQLPIAESLHYIRQHFDARRKFVTLQGDLSQLSAQFRLVQKRLISKFKVRNPTPLANLELLLADTFADIMRTAEALELASLNLGRAQVELSCCLRLIGGLIKLMDGNNSATALIESALNSPVYDVDGQGWEDVMDAALCYLLRTVLARSEKDKLRAAHTSFEDVKDVAKVEKHFAQVLERLTKSEAPFPDEGAEDDEGVVVEEETVPIGSQIGESSSRLLSARKSLLRKRHKDVN